VNWEEGLAAIVVLRILLLPVPSASSSHLAASGELAGSSGTALTGFVETFALDKRLPERLFSMLDCCRDAHTAWRGDFLTSFHGEPCSNC